MKKDDVKDDVKDALVIQWGKDNLFTNTVGAIGKLYGKEKNLNSCPTLYKNLTQNGS